VPLVLRISPDLRSAILVNMLTLEYGNCCSIRGFRCKPSSAEPAFAP
jgi:hypothetical protein